MTSVNDLVKYVGQLPAADFEEFYAKIQKLKAKNATNERSVEETKLLEKINKGLPRSKQMRWDYLIARRDSMSLTHVEQRELLTLTETVENYDVKRLEWITKLADLRRMSLTEVINFYKIFPLNRA
jgi:hypothetical protein